MSEAFVLWRAEISRRRIARVVASGSLRVMLVAFSEAMRPNNCSPVLNVQV